MPPFTAITSTMATVTAQGNSHHRDLASGVPPWSASSPSL